MSQSNQAKVIELHPQSGLTDLGTTDQDTNHGEIIQISESRWSEEPKFTEEELAAYQKRKQKKLEGVLKQSRLEHYQRIIANSGLKDVIERLTLDNFITSDKWQVEMRRVAVNYAKNPTGWMLLSGQSGCGKTHLCTAVSGHFLRNGTPTLYMRWRMDGARLKPNYVDAQSADKEIARYINISCLYIDDFLKGKITDADIKAAFTLIDGRYIRDCKTIISTELSPDQLLNIDEALGGRIIERCRDHIYVVRGANKNYRLKGNNWNNA